MNAKGFFFEFMRSLDGLACERDSDKSLSREVCGGPGYADAHIARDSSMSEVMMSARRSL